MSQHGYSIKVNGSGYAVFDGEERVSGTVGSHWLAEDHLDKLIRQGQMQDRACLTCGEVFPSEGKHNRMCDGCREKSRDMV